MLVDIPKDVQFATAAYRGKDEGALALPAAHQAGDPGAILAAVEALEQAERPILYTGGGVINAGPGERVCSAFARRPAFR